MEIQRAADQIVLGRFAPPGVLINEAMEIIQFRGRTYSFLEPAPGEPSRNLLTMAPFGVSQALRDAISEAKRLHCPVRRERIAHRRDDWAKVRAGMPIGMLCGAFSLASYVLALWAMTRAPIASVAAVRETSIVFGTLLGAFVLHEHVTWIRGSAACVIAAAVWIIRSH